MEIGKCTSWLHGKHEAGEINTKLDYIVINGKFSSYGEEIFIQGEDAFNSINEINEIYHSKDCTVNEALIYWANIYF